MFYTTVIYVVLKSTQKAVKPQTERTREEGTIVTETTKGDLWFVEFKTQGRKGIEGDIFL